MMNFRGCEINVIMHSGRKMCALDPFVQADSTEFGSQWERLYANVIVAAVTNIHLCTNRSLK